MKGYWAALNGGASLMRPNEWFRRKRRIRSLAFANSEDSAACYYEMRESAFIRTCFPNVNVKHVLQLLTQPQLKGTMFNLSLMSGCWEFNWKL
ncbi:MAG: hypothetical protein ACTS41_01635 [Candidatus Hodgkinia cicadicola]